MEATARLAARSWPLCRPNPGVAALLVREGRVIARGSTQAGGRPHAEAIALSDLPQGGAAGASLYVTLEPCAHVSERGPACTDLILAARPARVIIGHIDPDPRTSGLGRKRMEQAGIAVTVLEDGASRASLAPFLTRITHARPHVTLKLAVSLDGCIAMADGSSQWITGEQARAHVHAQRARHDAILVGGGTWRADQPRLNVRLEGLEERSPQRVVLTSGPAPDGIHTISQPEHIADLNAQSLYVEGGAQTAASFLARDLVDALHLYRAPILIGDGRQALGDIGLGALAQAHGRWALREERRFGTDHFELYERTRA